MWDFLKKIFSEREGDVTVVVLDDQNPDGSSSFKLAAQDIVKITLFVVIVSVLFTTIIFFATPLGSLYQRQQDESLRTEAIAITERLVSLQDSLQARDRQLTDMKNVLQTVPDTTFEVSTSNRVQQTQSGDGFTETPFINAYDMLSQSEIIFSGSFERAPEFPAAFPVNGSLSQNFEPDRGHFGIDIAARTNSNFTALADGVVIHTEWTINYGYVLYLQHSEGIVSVYKHASKILKQQGDFVLKGDILGTVSDTGVLSSGSHLHLEIWKNGIPQNPVMYLMN
ncbi:M23 family peptidase [Rhodohalobacter sp. SW132]|uniref:M23 family metallopeptidase n=1 Tax=Rhodohalobacter sp. SW132 TaxID=2293433 RepID=UPI000E238DB6|nr:M23 family metallopeptidase [Rhodohalobacter sp. SW132]REL33318.1 M23 family peptidase [Rhodohalobacter sp. SW132]